MVEPASCTRSAEVTEQPTQESAQRIDQLWSLGKHYRLQHRCDLGQRNLHIRSGEAPPGHGPDHNHQAQQRDSDAAKRVKPFC
jgi:hypothetical protein